MDNLAFSHAHSDLLILHWSAPPTPAEIERASAGWPHRVSNVLPEEPTSRWNAFAGIRCTNWSRFGS